jgi:hypothetical protein
MVSPVLTRVWKIERRGGGSKPRTRAAPDESDRSPPDHSKLTQTVYTGVV